MVLSRSDSEENPLKKIALAIVAVVTLLSAGFAISHSGGLDKYGCHTDHKNGDYHCHK